MIITSVLAASLAISGALVSKADGTPTSGVDTGTMSAISRITGAQEMWNAGFTGAGVGVAVIDTGVARVPGLDRAGKVIDGPDVSFDSQITNLAYADAFGHGTHIAGIIAGSDVAPGQPRVGCATCLGASPYTDTTKFVGIAPEATIVNVKVGAFDGAVDVSQVIAGINWVIQHRNDPGLNIRVLNLSYGTDSVQTADVDPLAFAVEQAWRAGIVVVVAGGNDGGVEGPLANPAISPAVVAVGATDAMGTLDTADDQVALFANHGTAQRGVDIAVPGVSVQSLRVPGGFVDTLGTTGKDGRFQRASGTSQSAAVVSGLAALIISRYPTVTPDMVKSLLVGETKGLIEGPRNKRQFMGSGSVNLARLATMNDNQLAARLQAVVPQAVTGTGTGSLEAARGSFHVTSKGIALVGERDTFGEIWNSAEVASESVARVGWIGGTWNNVQWTGNKWSQNRWPLDVWGKGDYDWTGSPWVRTDVDSSAWTGARWSGGTWTGARWSGARWSGGTWTGARWSGARWSDAGWS